MADALRGSGFEPHWVLTSGEALELVSRQPFDVVLTDLNMPQMNGVELCQKITGACPHLPVVVVTAFGSIDSAVEAMRAGAYDFVTKPFDIDSVAMVLRRAIEHHALSWEVDALRRVVDTSKHYGELLGTSQAMRNLFNVIQRVSANDAPVLITGESGTGKELVARELHHRGRQDSGQLIAINCAAMPEQLLEAELFGRMCGTEREPQAAERGLLADVQNGTILLDEIADMPAGIQSKLLRVLEDRRVRPLGCAEDIDVSSRIIATTNRDLEEAIQHGSFREDLYFRMNVIHIEVPPLRTRAGDTLLLAQSFLKEAGVRNNKAVVGFTTKAAEKLLSYDWPGNVRELKNCIERSVALTPTDMVDVDHLPPRVRDYRAAHVVVVGDDPSELLSLENLERKYILRVMEICQGNKSKVARVLGIGRKTLYRKLVSFGVAVPEDEA